MEIKLHHSPGFLICVCFTKIFGLNTIDIVFLFIGLEITWQSKKAT